MDKWVAARSTGPADQPGTICIEISAGPFDGNPKQEHFHATVIARVEDSKKDGRFEFIAVEEFLQEGLALNLRPFTKVLAVAP
jgi:hypothetical protein